MLGFLVFLAAFCWAFIAASLTRVWVVLAGGGALHDRGGLVDLARWLRLTMFANFRLSFAWLHTWFGLVLGFVLMVAFFFGSLSVFDREIDRWALPQTRIEPQPMPSFDKILASRFAQITEPEPEEREAASKRVTQPLPDNLTPRTGAPTRRTGIRCSACMSASMCPTPRCPMTTSTARSPSIRAMGMCCRAISWRSARRFFYPMHFSLHITWYDIGYWIVALAAMAMLAAIVSGVVMHRKIFREFFTFRPGRSCCAARSTCTTSPASWRCRFIFCGRCRA